jgi:type I restriction enzyme, R subunit
MVDEAHRTQEGDLGRKMREALPNAFLFGLTGTPINRADRNTFWAFGADEDEQGYMSRYSFQDSIRDKATLPLHFEAPTVKLKIDKAPSTKPTADHRRPERAGPRRPGQARRQDGRAGEEPGARPRRGGAHRASTSRPRWSRTASRRRWCLRPRVLRALQGGDGRVHRPEASAIVMSAPRATRRRGSSTCRDKDAEEKLLDRFRDPGDPLKFVIVTSKLLTGFDAPILQVMYLDKPMKDHNLLRPSAAPTAPTARRRRTA